MHVVSFHLKLFLPGGNYYLRTLYSPANWKTERGKEGHAFILCRPLPVLSLTFIYIALPTPQHLALIWMQHEQMDVSS